MGGLVGPGKSGAKRQMKDILSFLEELLEESNIFSYAHLGSTGHLSLAHLRIEIMGGKGMEAVIAVFLAVEGEMEWDKLHTDRSELLDSHVSYGFRAENKRNICHSVVLLFSTIKTVFCFHP